MPTLELSHQELNNLVAIVSQTKDFPWVVTNPLLSKLGPLLQQAQVQAPAPIAAGTTPGNAHDEPPASSWQLR